MSDVLYMHRLVLSHPLALHRYARELRMPDHPFDPGYVLHCLLAGLFGQNAPKPFVWDPKTPNEAVLAYDSSNLEMLKQHAETFATPDAFELVDWRRCASKPMHVIWHTGTALGFRVRACPLVRGPAKLRADSGDGAGHRSPEVDAYQAYVWRTGNADAGRETVYTDWLARELARDEAAELQAVAMRGFRLSRSLRRTHGETRKGHALTRPDVLLEGTLRVGKPEAFGSLLARGVGRHRAFGYGMLLLRPVA